MTAYGTFRATSYPWRLYSGSGALEQITGELDRATAKRAFVICGRTVARETNLLQRLQATAGERFAGLFDHMDKDCSYPVVSEAAAAARAAGADLLIAVGGGSVIVGTRAVAIFLGEPGSPFELMTQYPEGKPAFSPRLLAPKPPIINVVTTPTSAMNRAGTGLRNDDLDHRMEYYDPKTRPVAIVWDAEALLTAPAWLVRSTGTTTFTTALGEVSRPSHNPLVEGDRLQAFRLAKRALPLALAEPGDPAPRIDLCAAALLGNRAADDDVGARTIRSALNGGSYALATALHLRYHTVGQGEATSALIPAVVRGLGPEDASTTASLAAALGVAANSGTGTTASEACAGALTAFYESIGMPARVRDLEIPRDALPLIAQDSLKNFNANPGERSSDQFERLLALLEAAW